MKRIILSLVLLLLANLLFAQVPQGIKYQAVIRNSNGEVLSEQNVALRISILQSSTTGSTVYSEEHAAQTNTHGLVNFTIGEGTIVSGDFSGIPWEAGPFFIKIELDAGGGTNYTEIGTTQLLSVPYALYSGQTGEVAQYDSDTLFVVKDNEGNVVFAVFPDGAKVYVNEDNPKGLIGGFAVSGRNNTKGEYEVMRVTPDSTRIFVNQQTKGPIGGFAVSGRNNTKQSKGEFEVMRVTPDGTIIYVNDSSMQKGPIGGFAVSGRNNTKGDYQVMKVTPDSTRIYINQENKGPIGGFAVSGRNNTKDIVNDYFNISSQTTAQIIKPSEPRILWYPEKEAFLTGRVFIEGPDSVGTNSMATGFESKAVGDYSQAMGYQALSRNDYTTAIGHQPIATGQYSVAIGKNSKATDKSAYAFGEYAKAKGYKSYALGYMCSATGLKSYCIGSQNDARGETSIAIGHRADANGNSAVAMGRNSQAIGYHSIAIGVSDDSFGGWTTASGSKSIAMGTSSESNQYASFTYGFDLENNDDYSVVLGKYNEPFNSGTSLIVGNGTSSSRSNAMVVYENGDVEIAGNLTENSDIRLKNNIKSIGSSLKKINNLNPVYFNFKNKTFYPKGKQIGLIAQEVKKIFPEFVRSDENGFLSVNYSKMSVILIKAIQEQNKLIERLDEENRELKEKIDKILQMIKNK